MTLLVILMAVSATIAVALATFVPPVRTFVRKPFQARIWHVVFSGFIVGVVGAAAIFLSHSALENAKKERRRAVQSELAEQKARLEAEITSKAEIRRIARRQAKLERPTSAELVRIFRSQLAACRGVVKCRVEIQHLSSPGPTVVPNAPTPQPQKGGGRGGGNGNGGGGGQAGGPPPPPQPRPPVDVHTPPPLPPVQVCLRDPITHQPLVGVNCP